MATVYTYLMFLPHCYHSYVSKSLPYTPTITFCNSRGSMRIGSFGTSAREPMQSLLVCHVSSLLSLALLMRLSVDSPPDHRYDHKNFTSYIHTSPVYAHEILCQ